MVSFLQANMLRDMAVMMGGQIGGSIANQAVTSEFSDMQTALTTDQTNVTTAMNSFATTVQAAQKTTLTNVFSLFSRAQSNISGLLTEQQASMTAMDAYLQAVLDRQQPQAEYLTTPTTFDQYFTLATMYTPQGPVWKNPFPVGNWEYDEKSDSFWQMSNVGMMNSSGTADQAPNNSIFTEFYTRNSVYAIEAQITLYNVSYPFFVGLIFNQARWISGDQARLQKYRLLGVYGDANSNVQTCFAEAVMTTPAVNTPATATAAAVSTPAVWSYPLSQIVAGSGVQQTSINKSLLQNLKISAVKFYIKIKNSPNKIQYKIWPLTATEPTSFTTVQSQTPDLYLYHGIGFMAPGTIAEFKLLQPKELLFSVANKTAFQTQVQTLVQQTATAGFSANIDAVLTGQSGATT